MLNIIIGLGIISVVLIVGLSCCVAAGREDEWMENQFKQLLNQKDKNK